MSHAGWEQSQMEVSLDPKLCWCGTFSHFFIKVEKMNLEGMRPQSPRGLETLGQEPLNGVVNGLE